jgi:two-component system sensor histidine kinase UhpB
VSLRIRLSLIVSMLFFAGMLLGLVFLVSNARQRVAEEVQSAATLAQQLLSAVLQDASIGEGQDHARLVERLRAMENVRHLEIAIAGSSGASRAMPIAGSTAPAWFVFLVQAPPLAHEVALGGSNAERIIIRTNPADEIDEVWLETRNFIVVLLLVLLLLNGLLYFILGRWLAPVSAILTGLDGVEHGDFSGRVPEASLPELKAIVEKLNQLTAVLRSSKAENERLSRHSLRIQEEERRYLAHELHDEFGQSISAIKAIAFSIAGRVRTLDEAGAQGAERIGSICNQVSGHVRSMMGRLRPAILDELGLVPALQAMIDDWNRNHRDTFCSFRASGDFAHLDAEQQIGLYRIVQEALTNVAKHAHAERVDVVLEHDDQYRLCISDNGCGFDVIGVRPGMGLSGIRERSQALGGRFTLQAAAGVGVQLQLEFSGARGQ